jgi:hypothetical protein
MMNLTKNLSKMVRDSSDHVTPPLFQDIDDARSLVEVVGQVRELHLRSQVFGESGEVAIRPQEGLGGVGELQVFRST